VLLGPLTVLGDPAQLLLELGRDLLSGVELVLGEQAGLDPLGDRDLLDRVQQGHAADQLQVVLDRVGGGTSRGDLRDRTVVVSAKRPAGGLVLGLLFGGCGDGRLGHGPPVLARQAGGTVRHAAAPAGSALDAWPAHRVPGG